MKSGNGIVIFLKSLPVCIALLELYFLRDVIWGLITDKSYCFLSISCIYNTILILMALFIPAFLVWALANKLEEGLWLKTHPVKPVKKIDHKVAENNNDREINIEDIPF